MPSSFAVATHSSQVAFIIIHLGAASLQSSILSSLGVPGSEDDTAVGQPNLRQAPLLGHCRQRCLDITQGNVGKAAWQPPLLYSKGVICRVRMRSKVSPDCRLHIRGVISLPGHSPPASSTMPTQHRKVCANHYHIHFLFMNQSHKFHQRGAADVQCGTLRTHWVKNDPRCELTLRAVTDPRQCPAGEIRNEADFRLRVGC
jgi:hypothetical protein